MIYWHAFMVKLSVLVLPVGVGLGMCLSLVVGFLIGYYHQRFNRLERRTQREIDGLKRDVKDGRDREHDLEYRVRQLTTIIGRRNGVSDSVLEQVDDIEVQFQRLRKTARRLRGEEGGGNDQT